MTFGFGTDENNVDPKVRMIFHSNVTLNRDGVLYSIAKSRIRKIVMKTWSEGHINKKYGSISDAVNFFLELVSKECVPVPRINLEKILSMINSFSNTKEYFEQKDEYERQFSEDSILEILDNCPMISKEQIVEIYSKFIAKRVLEG